jgi:hypothetical protein
MALRMLGYDGGFLAIGLGQQDGEFLTAETSSHIIFAHLLLDQPGDALNHCIPGQVPIEIVDLPQQIEIRHDQRQWVFKALGSQ